MSQQFGGNGGGRTLTGHRMKVLHYHYATLPYRNTLTFLMSLYAMGIPNVFLYGRGTENRTLIYGLKARYFSR